MAEPNRAGELQFYDVLADALEAAAQRLRSAAAERNESGDERIPAPVAPQDPEERLTLSVSEAAARLGISRSSAYEAVRVGTIPSLKIGRRLLVPVHALRTRLGQLAD
jgi:excisionase family DNA binding protein